MEISKIKKQSKKQSSNFLEFLNKDLTGNINSFNDKKKEAFYNSLHTLYISGLDIKSCLEIIIAEQSKKKDIQFFKTITENIVLGDLLSAAMKKTGKISDYEYYCLMIGEESSNIQEVLFELKSYFKNNILLKRQVINALTYPAIIILVSIGAIGFMLNFVVPMFADVFLKFGEDLPAITKTVIKLSNWIKDYFGCVLLIVAFVIMLTFKYNKNTKYQKLKTSLILKIPIAGQLARKVQLSKFCMTMSLLLTAKVPLLRAIDLSSKMIVFYPLRIALEAIQTDILNGGMLYKSLEKYSFFEKKMVSLIRVGEEVNKLELIFKTLNQQYTSEIEHQTKVIGSLVEPFVIIFLGGIIAVILVAMYLPMFQIGNAMH